MKRYVVYDNLAMGQPAEAFFAGLAAMVGGRFEHSPAISVEVKDEELAVMIERILTAAGVKYSPVANVKLFFGTEVYYQQNSGLPELVHTAMEQIAAPAILYPATETSIPIIVHGSVQRAEETGAAIQTDFGVTNHEQQAKGKRPRNGKAIVGERVAEAPMAQPEEAVEGKCEICGKPVSGKRSKLCGSKDCKKAWNRVYQREYARSHARKKGEERKPSDADLHEVEEFEQILAAEMAAEGLPAAVDLPAAEELSAAEEPTLPVEEEPEPVEAAQAAWSWLVEDGPRKGSRMTNKQIVRLLMNGNLRTGQHIRHERLGQCEVVKGKNPPMQKLKQLYGAGAPRFILPAEIAVN